VEHESEDSVCVRRVLNGEQYAFDEIVRSYEQRVFSLLFMMTRDRSGAEEVAQDAFLRAYANLQKYDPQRPLYPWLATIAARLGINWINRTGARQTRVASDLDVTQLPAGVPNPADDLELRRAGLDLWDRVAHLPQGERTAVLMFYKQELTVSEIANILGVTKGTIKTLLHRGRAHLRVHLASTGGR